MKAIDATSGSPERLGGHRTQSDRAVDHWQGSPSILRSYSRVICLDGSAIDDHPFGRYRHRYVALQQPITGVRYERDCGVTSASCAASMTVIGLLVLLLFLLAALVPVFARAAQRVNRDLATLASMPASAKPAAGRPPDKAS